MNCNCATACCILAPPQPDVTCQALDVTSDGYSTRASNNSSADYYNCRDVAAVAPFIKTAVPVGSSPFLPAKHNGAFRPIQSYIIQKPFEDDGGAQSVIKGSRRLVFLAQFFFKA